MQIYKYICRKICNFIQIRRHFSKKHITLDIKAEFFFISVATLFFLEIGLGYGNSTVNPSLKNNLLEVCPESPNCVSSQSTDSRHKIIPLRFLGSLEVAKNKLHSVINLMGNSNFVTLKKFYWHVEFTSRWLGFVDDVEFYFVESESLIHVRSASRIGYWDFGVNRRRVEEIRSNFEELVN